MKNKVKIFTYFLITFFSIITHIKSDEITFDASEVKISKNGQIITALKGKAISMIDKIEIDSGKFVYDKNSLILKIFENAVIKNKNKIIKIKTRILFYDLKKKTVYSKNKSKFEDNFGNIYIAEKFNYNLKKNLIKIENVTILDDLRNVTKLKKAFINLDSNKLIAKDVLIELNDDNNDKQGNTRLAGNAALFENNQSTVTRGVFTTCKKTDDCPPWQLHAKEIKHNKSNKTIYYKDAWLKIYDTPVFYFPRFFHPDPTVKRRSGFLAPSTSDSSSAGLSVNTPFFYALSDSRDMTIKPRIYLKNKQLLQTEYRAVNKDSKNTSDFSILKQNNGTKNHLFSNYTKQLDLNFFEDSNINLQLQHVTGDTYLKTFKIESPLIDNKNTLNSLVEFDGYRNDLDFNLNFNMYEDLSLKKSDRYEFIFPNYKLSKKFWSNNDLNGSFLFDTGGYLKNRDTNIFNTTVVNNISFASNSIINKTGFKNDYNILFKNTNKRTENPYLSINSESYKVASLIEYNSSYPLSKEYNNKKSILTPKVSFKYSPNKNQTNLNYDRRINVKNIFSNNRIGSNENVEGGLSMTYGTEFSKLSINNTEIINLKLANNLRFDENKNLPSNSTLGKKTSDFYGEFLFNPNKILNLSYDFSIDENMHDHNYQSIKTSTKINNFVTTFKYINENNTSLNNSYFENKTTYNLDDAREFSFKTRENKKTSLTEFYNLIYKYRNDCLIASLEYNKDFYEDRGLKPEENIFFKLTVVPFGEGKSPNILKR